VSSRGGGASGGLGTPPARRATWLRGARCTDHGCLARTRTSVGAPPTPRFGVSEAKLQNPGTNAPRERDGLFEIVTAAVQRRAAMGHALIPRQRAQKPNDPRRPSPASCSAHKKSPGGLAPPGSSAQTRHASIKERCRGGRGCEGRSCPYPGPDRSQWAWLCRPAPYRSLVPRSMPSPTSGRSHRSPHRTTV
jgi:hypothetical protein